jgi:hypothetical protein
MHTAAAHMGGAVQHEQRQHEQRQHELSLAQPQHAHHAQSAQYAPYDAQHARVQATNAALPVPVRMPPAEMDATHHHHPLPLPASTPSQTYHTTTMPTTGGHAHNADSFVARTTLPTHPGMGASPYPAQLPTAQQMQSSMQMQQQQPQQQPPSPDASSLMQPQPPTLPTLTSQLQELVRMPSPYPLPVPPARVGSLSLQHHTLTVSGSALALAVVCIHVGSENAVQRRNPDPIRVQPLESSCAQRLGFAIERRRRRRW